MRIFARNRRVSCRYILGVDEVGRGPIAGPVAVGMVKVPVSIPFSFFFGIKDSKALSSSERERWVLEVGRARDAGLLEYAVSFAGAYSRKTRKR